jgi:type IV secretion system protein TrbL
MPEDPSGIDPFSVIGDAVGSVVTDAWTGIMLSLWGAGLWVLKWVLTVMDRFMTPDITSGGPAANAYNVTFWAAGVLVLVMTLVQIGVASARRDGRSLARVLIGGAQFIVVWSAWISYGVLVIAACGGLARALMKGLLDINAWSQWDPMGSHDFAKGGIEASLATVLGILGLFLWIAAIGHFIVMLARAAALLILAAVTPVAAAGLVTDAGRTWFWKSLRWFHAAALTPVVTILVLGIGAQITTGNAQGASDSPEAAVGTALPGVMLILVSVVAPVALFRLLAFVDPGTASGASMRAGMSSAGGVQGLLGMKPEEGTSGAASTGNGAGQAQGEAQSNEATAGRFGSVFAKLGGAGSAYAAGIGALTHVGSVGAAVGIDNLNQTGVGDSSYFPDYQRQPQRFNPDQRDPQGGDGGASDGGTDPSPPGRPPLPPITPPSSGPTPPSPTGGSGGAVGIAAEVPPVA